VSIPTDPAELNAYITALTARAAGRPPWEHLEELFTSPRFFGVDASPLQRAICRIADGRPLADLAAHPDILAALAVATVWNPKERPLELVILSAIRAGKSLLAAAWCLHVAMTCDVSRCSPGDIPRVSVVSVLLENARAVYDHLVGNMRAKPELKELLVGEPKDSERVAIVRHPSGRPIEIMTSAGSRGGATLVSRWLAGVVFDEFPLMASIADGSVVNWEEQRKAVINRILPGGGIWDIGSPWAPIGPAYDLWQSAHGSPTDSLVLLKAPGWAMHPTWWTPERCAKAKENDPDAYEMTVAANFATPPAAMYAHETIGRATREHRHDLPMMPVISRAEARHQADRICACEATKQAHGLLGHEFAEDAAPIPGASYAGAIDPAARTNSFTLSITTRVGARLVVAAVREWKPFTGAPLDLKAVFRDASAVCARYGVTWVESDAWAGGPLDTIARDAGLIVRPRSDTTEEIYERYKRFRDRLDLAAVELPPVAAVGSDLRSVRKVTTTRGFTVHLPKTSNGRHCDTAPAVTLAADRYLRDVAPPPPPEAGTPEAVEAEAKRVRDQALKAAAKRGKSGSGNAWWKRRASGTR